MKSFLTSQIASLILGSAAIYTMLGYKSAASFCAGSFLVLLNFLLLAFVWSRVFQKKQIALAVSLIVFKYAILGVIIYWLVQQPWIQPIWLAAGLASLIFSALISAFVKADRT